MNGIILTWGRKIVVTSIALCATFLVSSPLMADTYAFGSFTGVQGTSLTFTGGAGSITAYGWGCFNTTDSSLTNLSAPDHACSGSFKTHGVDLYGKTGSSTETGLGIYKDPQNDQEVSNKDYIDFDLSSLSVTSGTWTFGSLQVGEQLEYCFGNSNTGLNNSGCVTYTGSGTDPITLSLNWNGYNDITVFAPTDDILVESMTTTSVPEPGSLALFGTGLLGLVGVIRRKINL